jgi:hypothetical protein
MNETVDLPASIPAASWRTTVPRWLVQPAPLVGGAYQSLSAPRWTTWTAAFVLVGGMLHLAMLPAHLAEARGVGLYFLAMGAAQVVWGCLFLLKPTTSLARGGLVLLTAAPVALWVLTRTLRAPWGLGPEALDVTSIATVALEASSATLLVFARLGQGERKPEEGARVGVAAFLVLGLLVGGASYGAGMVAEVAVPWLGEPETSHMHSPQTDEMPVTEEPAPHDESQPHGHG